MKKTKKILFLTMVNMTNNPRIVKEMDLAIQLGYEVTLIAFKLGNWSDQIEEENKKRFNKATLIYIDATRKNLLDWLMVTVKERIYLRLFKRQNDNFKYAVLASRRTLQILKKLNEIKQSFDLISAHTIDTIYPAYLFSNKNNIPFYFDMEDYHPGEEAKSSTQKQRKEVILKNTLPAAAYLSYASPLIGKAAIDLLSGFTLKKHFCVNNSFWMNEFTAPQEKNDDILQLVWFSLNISKNRGLEGLINKLKPFRENICLNLIGNLRDDFNVEYIQPNTDFIKVHNPLPQMELHQQLSCFDIGLALEQPNTNLNRDICLTNKIWAYCQAGLYIIATDTSAQRLFLKEKKEFGETVRPNYENLNIIITSLMNKKSELKAKANHRYLSAINFSFDEEAKEITEAWSQL